MVDNKGNCTSLLKGVIIYLVKKSFAVSNFKDLVIQACTCHFAYILSCVSKICCRSKQDLHYFDLTLFNQYYPWP